jgi:hypothetical protein
MVDTYRHLHSMPPGVQLTGEDTRIDFLSRSALNLYPVRSDKVEAWRLIGSLHGWCG